MHAFEIWNTLSKELNHEILQAAYLHEKRLYRQVVEDLSEALRKRPQAILEIPRETRHELFKPLLALPQFNTLGSNLIIQWLGSTHTPMLALFLDTVGVAHDGKGCAESFPKDVEPARLEKACAALYEKYPPEQVSLYLHLFPAITGTAWAGMEKHIQK